MPLKQSPSNKAFKSNLKTEMQHGKPQKQALAIAYSTKRANMRKKAKGGLVPHEHSAYAESNQDHMSGMHGHEKGYAMGGSVAEESMKSNVEYQHMDAMHAKHKRMGQSHQEMVDDLSHEHYKEGGMVEDLKPLDIGSRISHKAEEYEPEDMDDTYKDRRSTYMAEGGAVDAERSLKTHPEEDGESDRSENEKLHSEHESGRTSMVHPGISSKEDSDLEEDLPSEDMDISLHEAVLKDRQRRMMASGGSVESYEDDSESSKVGSLHGPTDSEHGMDETHDEDEEDASLISGRDSRGMNLEPVHTMDDEEHEQSDASDDSDEDSIVVEILKDRKMRRRGQ